MRTFDEFLQAAMNDAAASSQPSSTTSSRERDIAAEVVEATAWTSFIASTSALPEWAETLRVSLPCSADALKQAFRRRAFETHPDRSGGSHKAFLAVCAAHDEGLAAVRAGGGTALPVAVAARVPATPSCSRYAQDRRAARPSTSAAVA